MLRPLLATSVFVFCLAQSFPLAGQYTIPAEDQERVEKEMCKKLGCAFDVRIVLKQPDGSTYDKRFRTLPVVQPNGVSVYAGQRVLFEADVQGDQLTNFKLVKTVEHPEKTLSASLEQRSDNSMALTMQNPFNQNLKIDMGIMPLDRHDLLKTSSCPVLAEKIGIELWSYPIFQVTLGNLRLLKVSDEMACTE